MIRLNTISQLHKLRGLPGPEHPLISLIDISTIVPQGKLEPEQLVFDFYGISLKRDFHAKVKYGQHSFDFDSGVMGFSAPGQVMTVSMSEESPRQHTGWLLLIHPDFLWNTSLATKIRQYDFFEYAVHEALFVSEKEEAIIQGIIKNIEQECSRSIDKLTQDIIITQIEALLAYSERFYQRQFITRKIANHEVLDKLDELLTTYFDGKKGLPTVAEIAGQLHMSPRYLSGLLRSLTGLNAQQHIHEKLIEKAKELLSTTQLSVSEVAYALGFEHLQSFSKLFKTKTSQTPLEFRQSFN
jgi:AraC family transcriptional regulator, transcriptional activator of pobA